MAPPSGSFPDVPSEQLRSNDVRSVEGEAQDCQLEWLLCLANALQTCQRQPSTFEAVPKPLHLTGTTGTAATLPMRPWEFAMRKIQRWRESGSNTRDAA
jgi:hypothetical protein